MHRWDTMQMGNHMMTSSIGNFCHVTGHLCGDFTGHRWIPRTQRPVTRSFDVYFSPEWKGWVNNGEAGDFGTPSRPLWRHCNDLTLAYHCLLNSLLDLNTANSAGCRNMKMPSNQYRDTHYKDKTASSPYHIYKGHTFSREYYIEWTIYPGRRRRLYWKTGISHRHR